MKMCWSRRNILSSKHSILGCHADRILGFSVDGHISGRIFFCTCCLPIWVQHAWQIWRMKSARSNLYCMSVYVYVCVWLVPFDGLLFLGSCEGKRLMTWLFLAICMYTIWFEFDSYVFLPLLLHVPIIIIVIIAELCSCREQEQLICMKDAK